MPILSSPSRLLAGVACAELSLLVPVCATLFSGGADWFLGETFGVSWYGFETAWLLLAALILWLWVAIGQDPPTLDTGMGGGRRSSAWPSVLGLGVGAIGVGILWTGGFRIPGLSVRNPESALSVAAAFLALSAVSMLVHRKGHRSQISGGGGPAKAARPLRSDVVSRWAVLAAAIALGSLIQSGLVRVDANRVIRSWKSVASSSGSPSSSSLDAERPPDLVWIVVDTLRADALGAYVRSLEPLNSSPPPPPSSSSERVPQTPFLDALARRSLVFERALAPAPWTMPSMFSALTSRWPSSLDPEGRGRSRGAADQIGLDEAAQTWVDALRVAGYYAAGFQKNPFLGEGSGLASRFDDYRLVGGDRAEGESAAQLVNAVLRWADAVEDLREGEARPFFLYAHFMDPHIDYAAPTAWLPEEALRYAGPIDGRARTLHARLESGGEVLPNERKQLARLYAAEVAYLDAQLARLWIGLEKRGLLSADTIVAVSGDHGEQFGEHGGWEHGDLFVENVHVPFLISGEGITPGRDARPVSLLDLGPTLLGRLGVVGLERAEGRDLLGGGVSALRPVLSEYGARARVESGRWVWIEGRGKRREDEGGLFDREADPAEKNDVSQRYPAEREQLRQVLAAHRARSLIEPKKVRPREISVDLERELEALGYGASGGASGGDLDGASNGTSSGPSREPAAGDSAE
ncbi:MAG: sulfatase [Myxococcota bacterium]